MIRDPDAPRYDWGEAASFARHLREVATEGDRFGNWPELLREAADAIESMADDLNAIAQEAMSRAL